MSISAAQVEARLREVLEPTELVSLRVWLGGD
jgi:hypothetical protein